ncbi:MAG: hypothetical protein IE880_09315, partial [Epsilonproteobacteria bacterium]|nr:hypothetical protein [Campylobacterales bacterium]MBD3808892.1 hypothetical protein [Campylobacterota bacterium]
YKSTYIESVIQIYQKYPDVDFIFCALEKFYLDGTKELLQRYKQNQCLGYSIMSYLFYHSSIGGETSTVSMRSGLAKRILPIALESNWTTRADECLTWASSYYGAKKYYIHEPLVQYRIHGNNLYANQKFSDDYLYSHKRVVAEIEFYSYLLNKSNLDAALLQHPAVAKKIANLTVAEYRSQEIMRFKTMKLYIRIIMRLNLEFNVKIQKILKIISHFLKN